MTEQEQIEQIKKWWKQYNGILTVIISLILLSISAYKYWGWHQEKISQQASNTYEQMMVAFSNQDNKSVRAYANELLSEYKNTVYADAARMTLAKLYISHNKYPEAHDQLEYVASYGKMPAFQQIAKIRLARLLIAEQTFDQALAELNEVNDKAYIPLINEIKGDIYTAKGEYPKAMNAYRKAVAEAQGQGMGNLFLEMKTNELATLTQAAQTNRNKAQTA
jgi:predicted negative regulator of RcsB-dependent stress response